MYKFLQLLFFSILCFTQVYSQQFKGGIMMGLVASQVDGESFGGYHKAGMSGGIYVRRALSEKNALQMELKYIQKGSHQGPTLKRPDLYYSLRLQYIEVPFLYRFTLKSKYIFEAGLATAYLLNAQEDIGGYGYDDASDFKPLDINYMLGASWKLLSRLQLNMRFAYSLTSVRDNPGKYVYYRDAGQFNNLFVFSLLYELGKTEN